MFAMLSMKASRLSRRQLHFVRRQARRHVVGEVRGKLLRVAVLERRRHALDGRDVPPVLLAHRGRRGNRAEPSEGACAQGRRPPAMNSRRVMSSMRSVMWRS